MPSLHVLYVEDDRINIVLMEELFRLEPAWRLDCAEDGAEALALLAELSPDLLLIDMNLPDMNGHQLLERLRQDPRHAMRRCVALSADALSEEVAAARAAGFEDYWIKPIDVPKLRQALRVYAPTPERP